MPKPLENPFTGDSNDSFPEEPTDQTHSKKTLDPKKTFASAIANSTVATVWAASIYFTAKNNSEGPGKALSRLRFGPIAQGFPPSIMYSLGPIEMGIAAQSAAKEKGGLYAGIFAGATTEATLGAPFDVGTLRAVLLEDKWKAAVERNPELSVKLTIEDLKKLMPRHAAQSETTLRNYLRDGLGHAELSAENLKLLRAKTGVCLRPADIMRGAVASTPFAIARNLATYGVLATQDNSDISPTTAAVGGAAITLHFNSAVYDAAKNAVSGDSLVSSMRKSFATSVQTTMTHPERLAVALGVRSFAIFSTAMLLGKNGQKFFNDCVETVITNVSNFFGIEKEASEAKVIAEKSTPFSNPQSSTTEPLAAPEKVEKGGGRQ